jgi:transcriptional regulator with XRE-family HTH domain
MTRQATAVRDEVDLHLQALGARLRARRVTCGHSLGAVAAGTGLSASFLSLVENGRSDISTGRLHRVARFLGVGLNALLDMPGRPGVQIVRSGERRAEEMTDDGLRTFPIVGRGDAAQMTPVVAELEPGAHAEAFPGASGSERFALVMRGRVQIAIAGTVDEVYVLTAGDAAYLRSPVKEIRNAGGERAVVLLVASATPPVRPPAG